MFDYELLVLAFGFYTRIPVPKLPDYTRLPQASPLLPVVGWVVGGLSGLCFYLADIVFSQSTAVILSLICSILLTGAFHEDGFADVCDGFGGGYNKTRILEIMKDSRVGVYGALGVFMLMALKISIMSALPAAQLAFVILAGHSFSRLPPLLLMRRYEYARTENSKGAAAMSKLETKKVLMSMVIALLPLLLLPWLYVLAVSFVLVVNELLGRYFYRHIGGYTGDCLGAAQQVAEVLFYLAVNGLWTFT